MGWTFLPPCSLLLKHVKGGLNLIFIEYGRNNELLGVFDIQHKVSFKTSNYFRDFLSIFLRRAFFGCFMPSFLHLLPISLTIQPKKYRWNRKKNVIFILVCVYTQKGEFINNIFVASSANLPWAAIKWFKWDFNFFYRYYYLAYLSSRYCNLVNLYGLKSFSDLKRNDKKWDWIEYNLCETLGFAMFQLWAHQM